MLVGTAILRNIFKIFLKRGFHRALPCYFYRFYRALPADFTVRFTRFKQMSPFYTLLKHQRTIYRFLALQGVELVRIGLMKQSVAGALRNTSPEKILKIHWKTHLPQSLFWKSYEVKEHNFFKKIVRWQVSGKFPNFFRILYYSQEILDFAYFQ